MRLKGTGKKDKGFGSIGKNVHEKNTPLHPTFLQINWCMEVYYFSYFFFIQNIDCGYL